MKPPTHNAKNTFRILEEAFGTGNFDVLDQSVEAEFKENQSGLPGSREGLKNVITSLRTAFPDLSYKRVQWAEADDKVWVHYKATGTHQNEFQGVPASGKRIEIDVIDIMRFQNGKMVEHWGVPDRFGIMLQIGGWPPA